MGRKIDSDAIAAHIAEYAFEAIEQVPDAVQQELISEKVGNQLTAWAQHLAAKREKLSTESGRAESDAEIDSTRARLLKIARGGAEAKETASTVAEIKRRRCSHHSPSKNR